MTENKRFGFEMDGNCYKCIADTIDKKLYTDKKQIIDLLNVLYDENEQLKEDVERHEKNLKDCIKQANWLNDKCDFLEIENESLEDGATKYAERYHKVLKENEELKQQLDYIQNSISEHIKHQKTELGQKTLKEIIEDYNDWLLGHKELNVND